MELYKSFIASRDFVLVFEEEKAVHAFERTLTDPLMDRRKRKKLVARARRKARLDARTKFDNGPVKLGT